MQPEYVPEALALEDSVGIEFCVAYLTKAWHETREESLARIMSCARREEGNLCVICRHNQQPVGMVLYRKRTGLELPYEIFDWVQGLYVVEAHRNSPAAVGIFLLLRKTLRSQGIRQIHLGVDPHVPKLKSSYLRMGFKEMGIKGTGIGHAYDILVMDL